MLVQDRYHIMSSVLQYIYIYIYVVLLLGYVLDAVFGFVSIFWGNVFEVFV